jgi:glycosyltransferase involved in cell wall biosynthesis
MRVLVVSNMWPGPAKPYFGAFVATRVAAYRRLGAEVTVVANDDPATGTVRTPWKYASLLARSLWSALRHRPQVVEAHFLWPTAVIGRAAAGVARVPYVLYAHGSDVDVPNTLLGRRVERAVAGAAEIHTNSTDTAQRIRHRFPDAPEIVVTPPGVDLAQFSPDAVADQPGQVILFAGNLDPHKGPDVLIDALSRLGADDWSAIIVGDGELRSDLAEQAQVLGISERITWQGAVAHEALPALLRSAAVVAVPSRRDALGQVAIEALACGVPVVVSDVGGLGAVPDDACGSVVEPDDPEALARELDRWLRHHDSSVAVAGRLRAEQFDVDVLARGALARLSGLAGSR